MPFAEDLTQFFQADEFAAGATLSGVAVVGIFEDGHVISAGGLGMSGTAPAFIMATSGVPANPVGRPLVVNSVTYNVADVEPDGTGITTLILERTV